MKWVPILKRNFIAWRKNWYSILFSSIETIIIILAFGIGFDKIVGQVGQVRYIEFIIPSIVIIPAMNNSFFETTYNSFSKMYYAKMFYSYLHTPATTIDIYIGEVAWGAIRGLISSMISLVIVVLSGLTQLDVVEITMLLLLAFVMGVCFGTLGMLLTSVSPSMNFFDYVFYIYLSPVMFLSGTFFPITVFPNFVEKVAFIISPLYHSLTIFRTQAVNIENVVYLILFIGISVILGVKLLERRLIR
ncbi:MAG: ABC transporter permease [Brevinematales bacterium]|nr:ABC transporter permease [Brevinematales bacterium]